MMWIECLTNPTLLQADPLVTPLLILGVLGTAASQVVRGVQAHKQGQENKRRLRAQGREELALRRRRARLLLGRQRSAFTAGGVSLSSPTAIDVLSSTAAFEEAAAQHAASSFFAEAGAQGAAGSRALASSAIGAGGTLLSGASTIALRNSEG